MSFKFNMLSGVVLAIAFVASAARADSISTGYDINRLLSQGHPFAHRTGTRWQPATVPVATSGIVTKPSSGSSLGTPLGTTNPRVATEPKVMAVDKKAGSAKKMPAQQSDSIRQTADTSAEWREATARASARGKPLGGILAEVSIGALMHDQGPFSNSKEDGIDTHIEIRFKSPEFLDIIWGPEPHIGANINSDGDTSQVFAGLSYEWRVWRGLFAGISFGAAYHDGETDAHLADRKDLGCSLLFRESVTLGWEITEHHKIAAVFDHISNAKICDFNEGLENIGARYSYRF